MLRYPAHGTAICRRNQPKERLRLWYLCTSVSDRPGDYILSLRVPNISSSYKLWIDGKPMAAVGVVGVDKASSKPDQSREIVSFYNGDGNHELIVEVSNFSHRRGGIWTEFYLGGVDALNDSQTIEAAEQMDYSAVCS